MRPGDNLYLVGPMGVGKTTIGRLLAKKMGREFLDLDEEIEARAGASIPWIFDVEGEAGFRRRESELLEECAGREAMVVSTGGGIVLDEANRRVLMRSGTVVYLNASVDQLYQRTRLDKKRPLLQVKDRRQVIADLKKARDPLYRQVADLVVDVGSRNSRQMADILCRKVEAHSGA